MADSTEQKLIEYIIKNKDEFTHSSDEATAGKWELLCEILGQEKVMQILKDTK